MNMNKHVSLVCVLGLVALSNTVLAAETAPQPSPAKEGLELPGTESRGLEVGNETALEPSKKLEIVGAVELKYGMSRGDSGHVNGPIADKAELGITYKPTDKFDLNVVGLYEDKKLSTDEVKVTWHAMPDDKLDVTAGKQYFPFGSFESAMVSDPITKEFGESRRNKVLQVASKRRNLQTTGYVFEGKSAQTGGTGTHKNGYGFSVGYEAEAGTVGVDYLSNLAESKHYGDINDVANQIPAIAVHGTRKVGRMALSGESMAALKAFQPGDLGGAVTVAAKPTATHLEAALDLHNDRTVAVAWNGTSNAQEIDMKKENVGVTYRQPIYKDLTGGIELMRAKGYDGTSDNIFTAQLSYEF
ncbi:LbtU family siderophore porin [Thiothrix lacustris]|uniref:LbtU family siderophore porin n=1 Tax=Thiothrix lacustris TaxID=525917 RepID=UPI0027E57037|nr:LbtU family siderophore porin [Thiothrix lacustris]WMP18744.1 LbtU family siderophore porin [Thiothrix lacustris]